MTQHRNSLASPVRRWLLLVGLLLVIVVVQAVMAQESAPVENPVTAPTEMPLAEIIPPPTDVPPAEVMPPTPEPPPADSVPPFPTDVPPTDSLPAPTDVAPVAEIPTESALVPTEAMPPTDEPPADLPTAEATVDALPDLTPEQTADMPGIPGDVIAIETPTETPVTEPPRALPGFLLLSSASAVPEGDAFTVTLGAYGFSDVSTVAVACRADVALLAGLTAATGGLLSANGAVVNDSGFKPDGQWLLVATLPESASADAGELWALNYKLIAVGPAQISCEAQAFDASGAPLLPVAASMSLSVEGIARAADALPTEEFAAPPTDLPTPPPEPVVPEASPEIAPETTPESSDAVLSPEVTPEVTPEPTPEVAVEPVSEVAALSRLSGVVTVSQPLMQATVTVVGEGLSVTLPVNAEGGFSIDLPAGRYTLTFSAPHYLSYSVEGYFPEGPLTLPPVTLTGGDADENGVVDGADVALVMGQFGVAMPAVAGHADLNGDQVVNIYDLAIVSANARLSE